jgi:phosphate starvation-inducible protein PhoH
VARLARHLDAVTRQPRRQARRNASIMVEATGVRKEIELDHAATLVALAGPANKQLKTIAAQLGVSVGSRGRTVLVGGSADRVELATRFFNQVCDLAREGIRLEDHDHFRAIHALEIDTDLHLRDIFSEVVITTTHQCPATFKRRSIPTCDRSTTRSTT